VKFKSMLVILLFGTMVSGCTSFKTVNPGGCGSSPRESICLGKTTVPIKQADLFLQSSNQAIDAISSQEFKDELVSFVTKHSSSGQHSKAWVGVDTDSIPDRLLQETQGMQIATFGGINGLFYKLCCGTNAFEGDGVGPILLNRWSLPRSGASIANTIVHEAVHRIGLTHPHSSSDRDIANCEPPYVIGSLVEKHILGDSWKPEGHCALL
jgi:hypothetical protein